MKKFSVLEGFKKFLIRKKCVLTNAFISSTVKELVTFKFTVCQSDPIFLVPKPTEDISILGYKFKNYLFFVFRIKKLLRNISSMAENLRNFYPDPLIPFRIKDTCTFPTHFP